MNDQIKTKRFTSRLPATPCTEELRNAMVKEAGVRKVKIAELQRHAMQFFLNENAKLFGVLGQDNMHDEPGEQPLQPVHPVQAEQPASIVIASQ